MKPHILLFACVALLTAQPAWAGGSSKAVDAGNVVCPVTGDKVDGKHFVTHQGMRYGLCCGQCAKDFKKDPEKYLASLAPLQPGGAPAGGAEHPGEAAHDHAHEHPGEAAQEHPGAPT